MAFVAAAEAALGSLLSLATAALSAGKELVEGQSAVDDQGDAEGRGARGRFSAEYNERRRGTTPAGEADARWSSDAAKAASRSLASLQTTRRSAEALAQRLFAMAVSPMLLLGRGFDGLTGPRGAWLAALGGAAYMPTTLDKTLAELGLLQADSAMWRAHAKCWHEICQPWCGSETSWLRSAVYVDGTADPYWTDSFAKSGKVSRVGRVMPCLTRIALNSGAGVPLLIETHVGAASLKKRLLPMLDDLNAAIGPSAQAKRLVVVDSEAGTAGMLWALSGQGGTVVITVIKGQTLAGADVHGCGPWQPYRERDQLREVDLTIHGKGPPDGRLRLRAVEMQRADGRQPRSTLFGTTSAEADLPTTAVADHYLQRWPLQEQLFRDARSAGILSHSHGYGGGEVHHVALASKVAKAEKAVANSWRRLDQSEEVHATLAVTIPESATTNAALKLTDRQVQSADWELTKRETALRKLRTMPTTIHQRDTGRDSIMTCLKLTSMALVEFVLKEFFGSSSMELRTFIEQVVAMPVTVRSSTSRLLIQIHPNDRNPKLMGQVAAAVDEVNRRALRRGKARLVFEMMPEGGGS